MLHAMWEQSAAQWIPVMIFAGVPGSAGCDDFNKESVAVNGLAVSGFVSTPFNVAVGGTDFDDVGTQTSGGFWRSSKGNGRETAQGYIHEVPRNKSCPPSATATTLNTACVNPKPSSLLNISAGNGGVPD